MQEEIIKKLKENLDLSIEELKYLSNFNNYYTLVNIFGKEYVVRSLDDITEDTICYVGDLYIDKKLPTYNLKYVYGGLFYYLDCVHNLENLVYVNKIANFGYIKSAIGLENLQCVKSHARFNIEKSDGLDNLVYVGQDADFSSLIDASSLNNLNYIGRDAIFNKLKKADGLENLKYIGGNACFKALEKGYDFNNLHYIGELENFGVMNLNKYKERSKLLCKKN